jgi:molybdate transport system ATP-binding protein
MINVKFTKSMNTQEGAINLNIEFDVESNSITAIFGKSGVGKTTLLRVLSGLIIPDSGFIKVNEVLWLDCTTKYSLPPQKRSIGFVFQDFALFPNMSVKKNIEYGLSKNQDILYSYELLNMIELSNLANIKPKKLSGGQQQRVALARALARKPELLLLDEPMSSLDYETRIKLQNEILILKSKHNISIILVSHDIHEICKLADKVIVIDKGKIQFNDNPNEVFRNMKLI